MTTKSKKLIEAEQKLALMIRGNASAENIAIARERVERLTPKSKPVTVPMDVVKTDTAVTLEKTDVKVLAETPSLVVEMVVPEAPVPAVPTQGDVYTDIMHTRLADLDQRRARIEALRAELAREELELEKMVVAVMTTAPIDALPALADVVVPVVEGLSEEATPEAEIKAEIKTERENPFAVLNAAYAKPVPEAEVAAVEVKRVNPFARHLSRCRDQVMTMPEPVVVPAKSSSRDYAEIIAAHIGRLDLLEQMDRVRTSVSAAGTSVLTTSTALVTA